MSSFSKRSAQRYTALRIDRRRPLDELIGRKQIAAAQQREEQHDRRQNDRRAQLRLEAAEQDQRSGGDQHHDRAHALDVDENSSSQNSPATTLPEARLSRISVTPPSSVVIMKRASTRPWRGETDRPEAAAARSLRRIVLHVAVDDVVRLRAHLELEQKIGVYSSANSMHSWNRSRRSRVRAQHRAAEQERAVDDDDVLDHHRQKVVDRQARQHRLGHLPDRRLVKHRTRSPISKSKKNLSTPRQWLGLAEAPAAVNKKPMNAQMIGIVSLFRSGKTGQLVREAFREQQLAADQA